MNTIFLLVAFVCGMIVGMVAEDLIDRNYTINIGEEEDD